MLYYPNPSSPRLTFHPSNIFFLFPFPTPHSIFSLFSLLLLIILTLSYKTFLPSLTSIPQAPFLPTPVTLSLQYKKHLMRFLSIQNNVLSCCPVSNHAMLHQVLGLAQFSLTLRAKCFLIAAPSIEVLWCCANIDRPNCISHVLRS